MEHDFSDPIAWVSWDGMHVRCRNRHMQVLIRRPALSLPLCNLQNSVQIWMRAVVISVPTWKGHDRYERCNNVTSRIIAGILFRKA